MSLASLLIFAGAYFTALVLPGPGVTALIARVLARGPQGAAAYIAGFICGALIWFTIAATGLAVLAATFATLFLAIRYAGAAYLLYLAWKFWRASPRATDTQDASPDGAWRLFLTGTAINLGNPKVIVFFLALLPTVVDLRSLTPLGFLELAAIVVLVVASVLGAYTIAAARARRLFKTPRAMRLMNRSGSVVMAAAAATIAAK